AQRAGVPGGVSRNGRRAQARPGIVDRRAERRPPRPRRRAGKGEPRAHAAGPGRGQPRAAATPRRRNASRECQAGRLRGPAWCRLLMIAASLTFLTPLAGLLALAVVPPLLAFAATAARN